MPGQLQFPTGCCSFMWRFSEIADRFLLLLHPEVDNSQESATLIEFSTRPHSQKLLNCCSKTFVFSQSSSVHISCPFSRGILFPSSFSLPLCPAEPVSLHCSTPGEQAVPPHSIISKAFQQCHRTWGCRSCYTVVLCYHTQRCAEMTLPSVHPVSRTWQYFSGVSCWASSYPPDKYTFPVGSLGYQGAPWRRHLTATPIEMNLYVSSCKELSACLEQES